MGRELPGLLKSYEFLRTARQLHAAKLSPTDARGLEDSIDRVFLDILKLESDDPRITSAQAEFLMSSMADLIPDADKGRALRDTCQKHLDRLGAQIASSQASTSNEHFRQRRYLDSLSDRVAVFDGEYRYVFTNKANADFHGVDAGTFVGRPNWDVISHRDFELFNKPRFDACMAGRSDAFITWHPLRDPKILYAVNMDPVRNANGQVTEFMVTSKVVSHLPIPDEMIARWP
jgi:PAS domain-containing protein